MVLHPVTTKVNIHSNVSTMVVTVQIHNDCTTFFVEKISAWSEIINGTNTISLKCYWKCH